MRINSISYPLNFGYSKKSQSYLDNNIAQIEEPEFREALQGCSTVCNHMEDVIKKKEKTCPDFSKSEYADLFISLKDVLTASIITRFTDSEQYLQSEYDYYLNSLKKCKDKENNWRQLLLDRLKFWDSDLGKTQDELKAELNEARRAVRKNQARLDNISQTNTTSKANESKTKSTDSSPLVEKLKRNQYSPRGFVDIMGMDELKEEFEENIVKPVNNPEQALIDFVEYGKKSPAGILLYGPPGCGKTYIIEALAAEINSEVYVMNSSNTGSKYVNQTANNIKEAFEYIYEKGDNSHKPILLFMDEIDAMTSNRDSFSNNEDIKSIAALLKYIEEAKVHNVIVIGATNKYDMMDPAIRRRFDLKRYVGLPDKKQRVELIENNLQKKAKGKKLLNDDSAVLNIANALEGYSCHSINIICDIASLNALKRQRADISVEDFEYAIEHTDEEKIDETSYKPLARKRKLGFDTFLQPKK